MALPKQTSCTVSTTILNSTELLFCSALQKKSTRFHTAIVGPRPWATQRCSVECSVYEQPNKRGKRKQISIVLHKYTQVTDSIRYTGSTAELLLKSIRCSVPSRFLCAWPLIPSKLCFVKNTEYGFQSLTNTDVQSCSTAGFGWHRFLNEPIAPGETECLTSAAASHRLLSDRLNSTRTWINRISKEIHEHRSIERYSWLP